MMFLNNPFAPVQDVVAEAKKERAQLDRLLKISTPREVVLVLVTGLVILLLGIWLFFGDVTRTLAIQGVVVPPGEQEQMNVRSLHAVVWLQANVLDEIKIGTPVSIEVELADGTLGHLTGKIDTLAPVALPKWYASVAPKAPVIMQRAVVALEDSLGPEFFAVRECRILADLGKRAPITLFGLEQS